MTVSEDSPSSRSPPTIGKIGPYTVFITPPPTPKPPAQEPATPTYTVEAQKVVLPPVQPPPPQFEKLRSPSSDASRLGFFWNALSKVQNAHSSLDEHVARWFGLNQSKYQWALDDYYQSNGVGKEDGKAKEMPSKAQCV